MRSVMRNQPNRLWIKKLYDFALLAICSSAIGLYGAQSGCSKNNGAQADSGQASEGPQGAPGAGAGANAKGIAAATANVAQLGDVFAEVAERVSHSVVSIHVEARQARPQSPLDFFFGSPQGQDGRDYNIVQGGGSGVILTPDGAILTNNHVVDKASRIEVVLNDRRRFRAKVVGTDAATDLAVLRIDAKGLPAASFADSNNARVGEWVIAIGSPFGLDYTVTAGVLSAKGRGLGVNDIEDYLQTDASINPGNSGGPLVNLRGEVLGINTMIIGRGSGIGFAIPSMLAKQVAEELQKHGSVRRAWIGVGFQELTPDLADKFGVKGRNGALIGHVVPGAPADKAGIQPGDVVVSVAGKQVREGRDLLRAVIERPVGTKLELGVIRNGKEIKLSLTTAERPNEMSARAGGSAGQPQKDETSEGFGLQVEPLTAQWMARLRTSVRAGVVVTRVFEGSAADRAGIKAGDIIVEADRKAVTKPQDLAASLKDGSALLRIERKDGGMFLVLSKESS
jgi:serine protease Do